MYGADKNAIKREEPKASAELKPDICQVNGCYLPASILLTSGSMWCCRYHVNASPQKWPAITKALRENSKDVMHLVGLQKLCPVDAQLAWNAGEVGTDKVPRQTGEDVWQYENRLQEWINGKITISIGEKSGKPVEETTARRTIADVVNSLRDTLVNRRRQD